ncbi:MAG: response regulator transcription factor [Phycisphaerales bacterium]
MTINDPRLSFDSLRRFADTVRAVTQLPGIPTATWGAQAAAAVAKMVPDSVVTVRLIESSPTGEFLATYCLGAHDTRAGGEVDPALLVVEGECVGAWWFLATTRSVALNGAPVSGVLRSAPGCERWEFSTLGRRWASMGVHEVCVGAKSCTKTSNGGSRWVIVELGDRASDAVSLVGVSEMLRAVMPELAQRVALAFDAAGLPESDATLTHREYEVLTLLARGRTVKQIAESLSRSPHTVHDHVKALHRKLGASSRGELVARALGHIDTDGNLVQSETDDAHESSHRAVALG